MMGGGWRGVGFGSSKGEWKWGSLIWGMPVRRAVWSMYSVRSVVVVVSGWGVSFVTRISQWSNGDLIGVYVGVIGSPTGITVSSQEGPLGICGRKHGVVWEWHGGLLRGGPVCLSFRL